jgi:transcriptional regulator NrdR family protein
MKKLVLKLDNKDKIYADELWEGDDSIIDGVLNEIETTETLRFEQLATVYKRYNDIQQVDSKFELVSEENNEVVVNWPDEDWTVKFFLE